VQQHVTIGVPAQSAIVSQRDPANLERNAGTKFMRVKTVADPQEQPLTRRGFTRINADLFSFVLINQPPKLGIYPEV
jgi:hypothetical protein